MTVSSAAVGGLALAALISLAAPFAVYFACRRRLTLPGRNIALGATVFVLFALVLEGAMHWYVLKHNPGTAAWMRDHWWGFAIYACAAAALFEETGRFLALRFFAKRTDDAGAAVAYGIGHGGAEALIVGAFSQIVALVLAAMMNAGSLVSTFGHKLPAAAVAKMQSALAGLSFETAVLGGLERFWALLLQIGFSLLVWRAVTRRDLRWLLAAMAAHAGIDSVAAAAQRGQISLAVTEAIVSAVGVVLLVFFLVKLPRRRSPAA